MLTDFHRGGSEGVAMNCGERTGIIKYIGTAAKHVEVFQQVRSMSNQQLAQHVQVESAKNHSLSVQWKSMKLCLEDDES